MQPPDDIHNHQVPEGVEEMTGAYIYVSETGEAEAIEDVFSKIDNARKQYAQIGLGENFVDQFIR